jgi:hypothetical protein
MTPDTWLLLVRALRAISDARLDNEANSWERLKRCSSIASSTLRMMGETSYFPYATYKERWAQSDKELDACLAELECRARPQVGTK